MALNEFYDYKSKLMEDLVTSEEIVKLVNPELNFEDSKSLIYKSFFPFEYVPKTIETADTFICFEVDIQKAIGSLLYLPIIYVWIFTHQDNMRMPDGSGVRTDRLASAVSDLINGSMKYGIGELDLSSVNRFSPAEDFRGRVLTFSTKDYNRPHNPNKVIPSNRRRG